VDPHAARPRAEAPVRAAPQAYASAPAAAAAPAAGGLEEVLAGAGLTHVEVTPELAQAFGEILRVVVAGVMDVLQARQRIKNEFRMRMTSFRPAQNNPLKFSANVDDALHNLLVKRNPAYLGPVEAFEDAFDDLRNHQMATLAGVRVAFEAMLAHFDPAGLQEQFDRQLKKGSLIAVPAKLRYWELYRDKFSDMVKDADTSFRELFGDAFTKAYEEQLDRLKAQSRAGRR
jgi:type VI secretion system FHA domain protein